MLNPWHDPGGHGSWDTWVCDMPRWNRSGCMMWGTWTMVVHGFGLGPPPVMGFRHWHAAAERGFGSTGSTTPQRRRCARAAAAAVRRLPRHAAAVVGPQHTHSTLLPGCRACRHLLLLPFANAHVPVYIYLPMTVCATDAASERAAVASSRSAWAAWQHELPVCASMLACTRVGCWSATTHSQLCAYLPTG